MVLEKVYKSQRLYEPYPGNRFEKSQWSYSEIVKNGLGEHFSQEDAADLFHVDGQHIVTLPPEALSELYYHLLFVFPEKNGGAVSEFHSLSDGAVEALHKAIFLAQQSIKEVAEEEGSLPKKIFAIQHNGPRELNSHPFQTTLAPLHVHVQSYDRENLENSDLFAEGSLEDFQKERGNRYTLRDPLFEVIFELLKSSGFELELNREKSSAYVGKSEDPNKEFTPEEIKMICLITRSWSLLSEELTEVFSNGKLDDQGRPILRGEEERQRMLELFCNKYEKVLSKKSQARLMRFSKMIKEASETDLWNWFFIGPAGAIAWEFDLENQTRRLIVAPRSFVVSKRNWTVLGEEDSHIVLKDRATTASESYREKGIERQRKLTRSLKRLAKEERSYYNS